MTTPEKYNEFAQQKLNVKSPKRRQLLVLTHPNDLCSLFAEVIPANIYLFKVNN